MSSLELERLQSDINRYIEVENEQAYFEENLCEAICELDERFTKIPSFHGFFIFPHGNNSDGIQCTLERSGKFIYLHFVISMHVEKRLTKSSVNIDDLVENPVKCVMDCLERALTNLESLMEDVGERVSKIKSILEKEAPTTYYKYIDGEKYDRTIIELCDQIVSESENGVIHKSDAAWILSVVTDGNRFTDVEKKTVNFIRANYKWTVVADEWFRTQVIQWSSELN